MKKQLLFTSLLLIATFTTVCAQPSRNVRFFEKARGESQLSYSFFTGNDASDFSTSILGFGSGILDVFGMRQSIDIIEIGPERFYLSVGAGFAVNKYRLAKNLVFGQSGNGRLTWIPDPDTSHNYVNTFFGYGKSKIITTSFYFPVDLNMKVGRELMISAGGFVDLNLTARYKMKYLVGDQKVKEIIKSSEFRKFNPSTVKFGVSAGVFHRKYNLGISASWCITPFFKAGFGPDIHETRVSATYTIIPTKKLFDRSRAN